MIARLTNFLSEKPQALNLMGGNLLYKVDFSLEAAALNRSFVLGGSGYVRVGPKKIKGRVASQYILENNVLKFESHKIGSEDSKLSESYVVNSEGFFLRKTIRSQEF